MESSRKDRLYGGMDAEERRAERRFKLIEGHLDERMRRLVAAAEAEAVGFGGASRVARDRFGCMFQREPPPPWSKARTCLSRSAASPMSPIWALKRLVFATTSMAFE